MRTELNNRIKKLRLKKKTIKGPLSPIKYAVLALTALWMSARFDEVSRQFLVLALIFGLKWLFESQKQIIQIFMQEERG